MTGEMKTSKPLCLKGFATSDGRDERIYASLVRSTLVACYRRDARKVKSEKSEGYRQ